MFISTAGTWFFDTFIAVGLQTTLKTTSSIIRYAACFSGLTTNASAGTDSSYPGLVATSKTNIIYPGLPVSVLSYSQIYISIYDDHGTHYGLFSGTTLCRTSTSSSTTQPTGPVVGVMHATTNSGYTFIGWRILVTALTDTILYNTSADSTYGYGAIMSSGGTKRTYYHTNWTYYTNRIITFENAYSGAIVFVPNCEFSIYAEYLSDKGREFTNNYSAGFCAFASKSSSDYIDIVVNTGETKYIPSSISDKPLIISIHNQNAAPYVYADGYAYYNIAWGDNSFSGQRLQFYKTAKSLSYKAVSGVVVINEHGSHYGYPTGTSTCYVGNVAGVMIDPSSIEDGYTFDGWKVTAEAGNLKYYSSYSAVSSFTKYACFSKGGTINSDASEITFTNGYKYAVCVRLSSTATGTLTFTAVYTKDDSGGDGDGGSYTSSGSGMIAYISTTGTLAFVASGSLACN